MGKEIKTVKDIPLQELLLPGHVACAGCGMAISVRHVLKILGGNTVVTVPACCLSVIQGLFPKTAVAVPLKNVPFASAAAVASGLKAGFRLQGKELNVVAIAGDGGTYDIGLQALSGAVERGEDIIYFCYDNQAYMNTGIQRSGATPYGAWTTTTPKGKKERRKDLGLMMIANGATYVATVNPSFPMDFYGKFLKAEEKKGPRVLIGYSVCPPGWRYTPELSIELGKLAVQTGAWILWEFEEGVFRFTGYSKRLAEGKAKRKPIELYLEPQGRFRNVLRDPEKLKALKRGINERWRVYRKIAEVYSSSTPG